MTHGIIIFGANGSGKTTLGRELARVLNYKHMDIEDYYFHKSDVPYSNPRTREECINLMLADIEKYRLFVISAVDGDFGDEITSMYDLAIFLTAPSEIRLERVKRRAYAQYGDRVCKGGDMYEQELKFYDFVASRSLTPMEQWAKTLTCPVVHVDGTKPIEELIRYILRKAQSYSFFGKTVTVTVDRQIGTAHPKHSDIIYPINYGYIAGEIAPDGEDLDVYILGATEPLTTFAGKVIAIIHRENDIEDKLVVAPDGCEFNQAEVAAAVHFQEQFYTSTIDCLWRKSAGMIVFRRDADAVRYLLLFQSESQTWSFPKGHMEAGETEEQAAIREVREEIGQNLTPLPNFRAALSYDLKQGATKTVALFLAEANGEVVIRESEIAEHRWVTAEEATELLPHANYAEILVQAERRIAK